MQPSWTQPQLASERDMIFFLQGMHHSQQTSAVTPALHPLLLLHILFEEGLIVFVATPGYPLVIRKSCRMFR